MSDIVTAIDEIVKGRVTESFIPCIDKANQESIRVMTFNQKNKLPKNLRELIAISKAEEDGDLFVRVYKKTNTGILIRDKETGKLVKYVVPYSADEDLELQDIANKQRQDGWGEDKIKAYAEEWVKGKAPASDKENCKQAEYDEDEELRLAEERIEREEKEFRQKEMEAMRDALKED